MSKISLGRATPSFVPELGAGYGLPDEYQGDVDHHGYQEDDVEIPESKPCVVCVRGTIPLKEIPGNLFGAVLNDDSQIASRNVGSAVIGWFIGDLFLLPVMEQPKVAHCWSVVE